MYQDITGIILSGGKSTRMGENKSFLKIGDVKIIEIVSILMKSLFRELIIITNEPELYKFLNIKTYCDIHKNVGPIAGIHSGLINSKTERNFIISCDMPLMTSGMICSIVDYPSDALITVPKADGFIQQLCGIYSKSLIPVIGKIIEEDNSQENRDLNQTKRKCKVHQLINSVPATIIDKVENLQGYEKNIFLNMNNPENFKSIVEIVNSNKCKL
ncbi:MAG: molybdenum cofactor guanylyltransferase [bacterium]